MQSIRTTILNSLASDFSRTTKEERSAKYRDQKFIQYPRGCAICDDIFLLEEETLCPTCKDTSSCQVDSCKMSVVDYGHILCKDHLRSFVDDMANRMNQR
jgi:hypothetical protein